MKRITIKIFSFLFPLVSLSQTTPEKAVNHQMQTWISLNTLTKWNENWGAIADFHVRWNDFIKDNNFYFLRGGINYLPNSQISMAVGYAHMWLASSNPAWDTYGDENRFYQQFQYNSKSGTIGIMQRLRNEQRWQEKIIDGEVSDDIRFTNRVRYLLSVNIPVSKKKNFPSLVLADEILIHFGDEVVYNTFDQNRFFVGIKKQINPKLSYDLGYMNVYQQKYSGYQYDMNHTLRLFFYLNSTLKPKETLPPPASGDE